MKMIEELFYGGVAPFQKPIPPGSRMEELARLVARNNDALRALLTDNAQQEQFQKCYEAMNESAEQMALDAFTDGFCLAIQLMSESMRWLADREDDI